MFFITQTMECQQLCQSYDIELCEPEDITNDDRSLILSDILHNLVTENQEVCQKWDNVMYYFNCSRGYLIISKTIYSQGMCFVGDHMKIYTIISLNEVWNYLSHIWDRLRIEVRAAMLCNSPKFITIIDFTQATKYSLVSGDFFLSTLRDLQINIPLVNFDIDTRIYNENMPNED